MTTSSQEKDWAAWMRAAMAGDASAYRRFLASVAPHVRAVVRSRYQSAVAPEYEVEDIVQDVLLTIHLKRGTWDPSRPIGPWVAAIARNKLIDILRRRGRHISVPIDDVMDSLGREDKTAEVSARDIDALLEQLKAKQRDIVRSISLQGSTIRETADRLHMSDGAVRVAFHRALKALAYLCRTKEP
jgi:RNA polymerase sigma factor (sigma-70 family)